ncbi:MAG: hypothetical protein BGO72_12455 [Burkholderiales bacterium 70-64]|nr:MAG: hypothetical protein BGO72_12455 [Burkholderiales bacterium 70-64]
MHQFHRVMQRPPDDHKPTLHPIDQEMPRPAHDTGHGTRALPTEAQVPRSDAFAEFRTEDAADPVGLAGDVVQYSRDQGCVAYAAGLSKLPFSPRE